MLIPVLLFIVGLLFLIKGGDWFVDGASALARRFHLPELLIGATVVSIGTTLPEVMVSTMSALSGHGEIAYGNAIGSVICNAALIAAITIAVRPGRVDPKTLKTPVAFFFAAAAIYCIAAYVFGRFTRVMGIIMLATFVAYMAVNVLQMKNTPAGEQEASEEEEMPLAKTLILLVLGAVLIAVGANLLVDNGTLIAQALGVPESVIALTFVALGTSLPELVTAVTSLAKGHSDLSLGNVVGANVFNLVLVSGKDGRAGTEPAQGWTDITAQCATKVAADGTFTVRTGDLIAALGGADAFTAGARVVAVYNAPLNSACNHGIAKGNPNEVYLRYPRSPFADQSGDAGFTSTPSDDACAYTWDLALTKRGSDGDKPLAGAVLSITDDRGRTLAADGTWDAQGKATVTTGEDGRVTVSGVDSGKLEVRELKAPKGYTAFEGTRCVTVKAEGLDVDQVAAAKPKLTITAESPLRADSADGSTGSLEASLINTPTGTPPSITTGGFMPSTGDMAMYAAAAAAVAGAALIVVALLVKRGGGSHKE